MKTITLNNGASMPVLGLGTWKSKPGEVYDAIIEALKIGYRHIDCAKIYGNEAEIGAAFTAAFEQGIVQRSDLWVTSKLWCNAHEETAVIPALQQTLKDLCLDYLDLYLVHWPVAFTAPLAPKTAEEYISLDELPIIETWKGMEAALNAGLTRTIGVSNFSVLKLRDLVSKAKVKPAINQVELHPYLQQNNLLDYCNTEAITLTAYSPLGTSAAAQKVEGAVLTTLRDNPVLTSIATKHACTTAQVLIQWAIARGTTVIPKSVNPERLKQNFDSINVVLDTEDMMAIAQLDAHFRFVDGTFWTMEGSPYTLANLWDE